MLVIKIIITAPYIAWRLFWSWIFTMLTNWKPNSISEKRRYKFTRWNSKIVCWLMNIKVVPHHFNRWVDGKAMIVSNHQSIWDAVLIIALNHFKSLHAPVAFIAKSELKKHFFLKILISLINVVWIDRDSIRQLPNYLEQTVYYLKIPRTMVLFPEGNRSHHHNLGTFKPFFLLAAQQSYAPLIPLAIANSYQVRVLSWKKNYVHVFFLETMKPISFLNVSNKIIANQIYTKINKKLQQYHQSNMQGKKLYQQLRATQKLLKKQNKLF